MLSNVQRPGMLLNIKYIEQPTTIKNDLGQNVNSAKVEKSCSMTITVKVQDIVTFPFPSPCPEFSKIYCCLRMLGIIIA